MMYNIHIFSEQITWNNTTSCGLCNFPKLIQVNGREKSPKSLDIKGFVDCLLLGDSLLNGHFRRNRPTTAHQVYLRVQMKRKSFDSLGNRLTVCTRFFCDAGVFFSFDELVNKLYDEAGE